MKKDKKILIRAIGLIGLAIGGVAALIGNWADQEAMKAEVKEQVEKTFEEYNKES